jgi:hypothetical protein
MFFACAAREQGRSPERPGEMIGSVVGPPAYRPPTIACSNKTRRVSRGVQRTGALPESPPSTRPAAGHVAGLLPLQESYRGSAPRGGEVREPTTREHAYRRTRTSWWNRRRGLPRPILRWASAPVITRAAVLPSELCEIGPAHGPSHCRHNPRLCNIADLARRDFYTAVTNDGTGGTRLDGRIR